MGELLGYITAHDTKNALELFNRLYTEGKDLSALLDELACLIRDLLVMKTAGNAGITMLSGVASDQEVLMLTKALTSAELVRMMNLIQTTLAGFTRNASRRMDAELCILEMCQPELSLDAKALNARLTRLEDQIKSGAITVAAVPQKKAASAVDDFEDDRPPMPDDCDAPPGEDGPMMPPPPPQSDGPIGFWTDLVAAVRKELKPPAFGFFTNSPNAPVRGVLRGNRLELHCNNTFIAQSIDKPEVLETVSRKAGAMLGQPVRTFVVDLSAKPQGNPRMDQLMKFGQEHSDIVRIKK
jgi:DNA polymerase-3 subunit gamma/tau